MPSEKGTPNKTGITQTPPATTDYFAYGTLPSQSRSGTIRSPMTASLN